MGKDALGNSEKKESTKSETKKDISGVGASPLIIIIALFAVIVTVMILFKDKLFKKPQNLNDLVEDKKEENPEEKKSTEQEILKEAEQKKIEDKFADKS